MKLSLSALTAAALIAAGLYGIEHQLELEEITTGNAYNSDKPHVPATLRAVQRRTLGDHPVTWADRVEALPDAPLFLIANEFFDALPIHQLVRSADGWFDRMVGLDGDSFIYLAGAQPMDAAVPSEWRAGRQGTIIETSPAAASVVAEIAGRPTLAFEDHEGQRLALVADAEGDAHPWEKSPVPAERDTPGASNRAAVAGASNRLALTGARLNGADAVHAGLATHFTTREALPALRAALVAGVVGAVWVDLRGERQRAPRRRPDGAAGATAWR